ncbi:MAG: DUF1292 domain-containing protein [Clostridia bacterium]|nr:DUF1292 domain-containing protein [Clostridia bacterium]
MSEELFEPLDNDTVTLMDEDGHEQEFEILDGIETDTARYVALMPIFDTPEEMVDASGELVIMRVEEEDDGEVLVTIEDDDEFEDVAAVFEERLSEYYEIDHLDG